LKDILTIIKNFLPNITAQTTIKRTRNFEIFKMSNEEIIKYNIEHVKIYMING
jgi:hypothetical protein